MSLPRRFFGFCRLFPSQSIFPRTFSDLISSSSACHGTENPFLPFIPALFAGFFGSPLVGSYSPAILTLTHAAA